MDKFAWRCCTTSTMYWSSTAPPLHEIDFLCEYNGCSPDVSSLRLCPSPTSLSVGLAQLLGPLLAPLHGEAQRVQVGEPMAYQLLGHLNLFTIQCLSPVRARLCGIQSPCAVRRKMRPPRARPCVCVCGSGVCGGNTTVHINGEGEGEGRRNMHSRNSEPKY